MHASLTENYVELLWSIRSDFVEWSKHDKNRQNYFHAGSLSVGGKDEGYNRVFPKDLQSSSLPNDGRKDTLDPPLGLKKEYFYQKDW